jgi:hypothetical protein
MTHTQARGSDVTAAVTQSWGRNHAIQYRRRAKREGSSYRRRIVRSRYVRAARTVPADGIEPLGDDNKGPGTENTVHVVPALVILLRLRTLFAFVMNNAE